MSPRPSGPQGTATSLPWYLTEGRVVSSSFARSKSNRTAPNLGDGGNDGRRSRSKHLEQSAVCGSFDNLLHVDVALADDQLLGKAHNAEGVGGVGVGASEGEDGVAGYAREDEIVEGRSDELDGCEQVRISERK